MNQIRINFILFLFICLWGCDTTDGVDDSVDAEVSIETSGLTDDKLPLNKSANFTTTVTGYEGDLAALSYRWTLVSGRAELPDGSNQAIGGKSISCIGKTAGEEQVGVEVIDHSNRIIAQTSYSFTIVPADDNAISRGCFDQPKIFYQRGVTAYVINYDGTNEQSFSTRGAAYFINISPNGEWIAWTAYDDDFNNPPLGFNLYLRRCDEIETILVPGFFGAIGDEDAQDSWPEFSPDSKTLYFLRPDPDSERLTPSSGGSNPKEIAAYDMETGEQRFLTSFYKENGGVTTFTVHPVTGELVFYRNFYEKGADGITRSREVRLSFLDPTTGNIRDFVTLPLAQYRTIDVSPDGEDIIFTGNTGQGGGIYRMGLTDGSQPHLLLPRPDPNRSMPNYPHYYADGSRIVYQYDGNLWTMDANGNDVQPFLEVSQRIYLQGVLY